jgi:hypothetical protein
MMLKVRKLFPLPELPDIQSRGCWVGSTHVERASSFLIQSPDPVEAMVSDARGSHQGTRRVISIASYRLDSPGICSRLISSIRSCGAADGCRSNFSLPASFRSCSPLASSHISTRMLDCCASVNTGEEHELRLTSCISPEHAVAELP